MSNAIRTALARVLLGLMVAVYFVGAIVLFIPMAIVIGLFYRHGESH
jgi:hypothetical protein